MSVVEPPPASRLGLLPVALVAIAVAALPFVTSERTALPAPWWLAVAVALLLIVSLHRAGPPRPWPDSAIASALGLSASVAHFAPGLVLGHDTLHHIWGSWAYLQAWQAGDLLPLWLHHLGLGMPLPLFYGPLPYWAMIPIGLAGGGPAHLLAGSFALAGVASGLSAWWATATWTGDRRAALVAAVAWAYSPYRLLDANYRAALGESWALALMPLVLVAFDRLLTVGDRRWRACALLAVALVTVAHPLSLVLLVVLLPILALARWRSIVAAGAGTRLAHAIVAGITGIALAGFFAVPLVVGLRNLNVGPLLSREGTPKYSLQGVGPEQVLKRRLWSAMEWARPDDWSDKQEREISIYFGLVLLAGLLGAVIALRTESTARQSPLAALAAVGWLGFALSFRPFAQLTAAAVRDLSLLQFPWRFLGPASAAAALALGVVAALAAASTSRRNGFLTTTFLALAALADGYPYSGAVARAEPWRGLAMPENIYGTGVIGAENVPPPWPQRIQGVFLPPWRCCAEVGEVRSAFPEYFTPTARRTSADSQRASVGLVEHRGHKLESIDALPYARLWPAGEDTPRALEFRRTGGTIVARLPQGATGRVEIAEQYFPGWQVRRDGRWVEVTATEGGLLQAEPPVGASEIRFRFQRWRWDRVSGWSLSLIAAFLLAASTRWRRSI